LQYAFNHGFSIDGCLKSCCASISDNEEGVKDVKKEGFSSRTVRLPELEGLLVMQAFEDNSISNLVISTEGQLMQRQSGVYFDVGIGWNDKDEANADFIYGSDIINYNGGRKNSRLYVDLEIQNLQKNTSKGKIRRECYYIRLCSRVFKRWQRSWSEFCQCFRQSIRKQIEFMFVHWFL